MLMRIYFKLYLPVLHSEFLKILQSNMGKFFLVSRVKLALKKQ